MKYFLALDMNIKKNIKDDKSNMFYAIRWDKLPEYFPYDTFDLENICKFTMSFEDYDDLFNVLLSKNLVKNELNGKNFAVVYKKEGIYKKIPFDVPYKNEQKYFDYTYLNWYIKGNKNNMEFLTKLARYFRTKLPYKGNYRVHPLFEPICTLEDYISKYKEGFYYNENEINLAIDFLTFRSCCKYDKINKTVKTDENGEVHLIFSQLRELAMFIINFERNKIEVPKKENIKKIKYPLERTRTFPKYEQMSILDY